MVLLIFFILASSFFFFFAVRKTTLFFSSWSISIPMPIPTPIPAADTLSLLFLNKIQKDLLPKQIELIILSPLNVVIAQIEISLFLGFTVSLPILFYQLFSYLSPALHSREKKLMFSAIFSSFFLFMTGCFFSYFFFVPLTFRILYSYVLAVSVKPFFEIGQFASLSILITLICGLIFLLPVIMVELSTLGLVDPFVWQKNWRFALIFFLIFAAIVSPDNTGITMVLITILLFFLYILGFYGSRILKVNKNLQKRR